MRTRRDQVQAYRFTTRRIVSAMVSGEPESNDLPMRRAGIGIVASLMVGTLVLAGFGIYGLISNGSGKLDNGSLVVEKGSGAVYVYVNDKLHPMLNYASARLYFGASVPEVKQMSEKSLRGKVRGLPMGIPEAPESLPEPKALVKGAWQVCSSQPNNNRGISHLVIGTELPNGRTLEGRGLLVKTKSEQFLLMGDTAMLIPDEQMTALGLLGKRQVTVSDQLVNVLVRGPNLSVPDIAYLGDPFDKPVEGRSAKIGDLFVAAGQNYVLTKRGLTPVGNVTAQLMKEGDRAVEETEISAAEATRLKGGDQVEAEGFPRDLPQIDESVTSSGAVCASYMPLAGTPGSTGGQIRVTTHATLMDQLRPPGPDDIQTRQGTNSVAVVDRIVMPGGAAVLAQAELSGGKPVPGATVYLITDSASKFALGSAEAQAALGYGGVTPVAVPGSMLAVIPDGPYLDQKGASAPADGSTDDENGTAGAGPK